MKLDKMPDYITRSKTVNQRGHAKKRFAERFGVEVNSTMLRGMSGQIRNGKATFVDRQTNRVTRWIVVHEGVNYFVVYDKKRKGIVTVLPHDALPC